MKEEEKGQMAKGIACDAVCNTFWVYSESTIYEFVAKFERRRIWEIYLKKCQFELAIQYCQSEEQKDVVYCTRGDMLFSQKKYVESAMLYAKASSRRFEDVVLLYFNVQDYDALKSYLVHKLDHVSGWVRCAHGPLSPFPARRY